MSAYRRIRANHSLLEICRQPELAAEVTLQPVDAIEVDAAILFSDLLLPLELLQAPTSKGNLADIDVTVRIFPDSVGGFYKLARLIALLAPAT